MEDAALCSRRLLCRGVSVEFLPCSLHRTPTTRRVATATTTLHVRGVFSGVTGSAHLTPLPSSLHDASCSLASVTPGFRPSLSPSVRAATRGARSAREAARAPTAGWRERLPPPGRHRSSDLGPGDVEVPPRAAHSAGGVESATRDPRGGTTSDGPRSPGKGRMEGTALEARFSASERPVHNYLDMPSRVLGLGSWQPALGEVLAFMSQLW